MNARPKIVVLKMRELLYTLLLLFLVVLLILCLILMFSGKTGQTSLQTPKTQASDQNTDLQTSGILPNTSGSPASTAQGTSIPSADASTSSVLPSPGISSGTNPEVQTVYVPGVYTSPVLLGESSADVEVTVTSDTIHSIRLVNLSETVSAAFPLVSPSLEHIAAQILEAQSLEGVTCPDENRYTSQVLLNAVADALHRATYTPQA